MSAHLIPKSNIWMKDYPGMSPELRLVCYEESKKCPTAHRGLDPEKMVEGEALL